MSSLWHDLSDDGLQNIRLQNRHIRVSVLPDAGGKVAELVDRRSGRQWLWRNPRIPVRSATYDADYGRDLDSGGWDEILLSLAPADLQIEDGRVCCIPDHGDVVGQKWSIVEAALNKNGDALCEMRVNGRALDYEFRRTLHLEQGSARLKIDYSLINCESFAWPFFWSLHALLHADDGLRIELPDKQEFRIDHMQGHVHNSNAKRLVWPDFPLREGKSIDLSRCFDLAATPQKLASKIFVRSPESGMVRVATTNTGETLSVDFDPSQLPWLGLWINDGGWSGTHGEAYRNLGLEPATAAFDCVSRAVQEGSIAWMRPREIRNWSVGMELRI